MLQAGPAMKVTIYLNQDTGSRHGFLSDEILALLQDKRIGVAGATVLRPYAGFGEHHHLHKAYAGDIGGLHLPLVIFFVDSSAKVNSILPALLDLVTDGLVEAHPTEVLKSVVGKEKVIS
jgi:uncharacterized protein